MNSAVRQVLEPVKNVVRKVADAQSGPATAQTVTVAVPVQRVQQFWTDPDQLSVVLGEIADVEHTDDDRYRWRLQQGPDAGWESTLTVESGRIRYVGTSDGNEIVVSYQAAPRDLGTEVTLRVKSPVPALLTGGAIYKILYRTRALLQTGEVPTLRSNPSARNSAR